MEIEKTLNTDFDDLLHRICTHTKRQEQGWEHHWDFHSAPRGAAWRIENLLVTAEMIQSGKTRLEAQFYGDSRSVEGDRALRLLTSKLRSDGVKIPCPAAYQQGWGEPGSQLIQTGLALVRAERRTDATAKAEWIDWARMDDPESTDEELEAQWAEIVQNTQEAGSVVAQRRQAALEATDEALATFLSGLEAAASSPSESQSVASKGGAGTEPKVPSLPSWVPKGPKTQEKWKRSYRAIQRARREYHDDYDRGYDRGDDTAREPSLEELCDVLAKMPEWKKRPSIRTVQNIIRANEEGYLTQDN